MSGHEENGDFAKGNDFWMRRSSHGSKALFENSELLWKESGEYFQWCIDNPFIEEKPMVVSCGNNLGSEVEMVKIKRMRPFTMDGLCRYLGCNTAYFRQFKKTVTGKKEDFATVLTLIEETVRDQQISGAAAGFLKENIVARINGLKDRTDVTTEDKAIVPITGMVIK